MSRCASRSRRVVRLPLLGGNGRAELAKFVRPFWMAASRSPSPSPSPAGRGNWYPASCLGRTSLPLAPCASRFDVVASAQPTVFDSPLHGGRFSLSSGEGRGEEEGSARKTN